MKYLFLLFISFCTASLFGQRYFVEDFDYPDFETMDSIFVNDPLGYRWSTIHARREVDISENGEIDMEELFKRTTIVPDPMDPTNSVIKLELNKISPYYYSKYSCDNDKQDNVLDDSVLFARYNDQLDLYCTDCSDSPIGVKYSQWRVHMMRNELSATGRARIHYKSNQEYWFGIRMMIDQEYELDSVANGEIITQFHTIGRGGVNPPVALKISKGRFSLAITKNNDGRGISYDLGPVEKDKWIDWKLHVVLSKKDEKGIVEVWRDGILKHSVKGRNSLKNYRVFLKAGIYKWGWWNCDGPIATTQRKVLYIDRIWASKTDLDL